MNSKIQVNGIAIYVEDTGETNLQPMLCLHSLFLDGRMFDELTAAAKGKFRVIRPEYRGQGRSDPDPSGAAVITIDRCADDMVALVDELKLKGADLVVQSMGGDVGFRLVARRPAAFKAMVVMGSSACHEPPGQLAEFREWAKNTAKTGFIGETLETTMKVMFGETTLSDKSKTEMLDLWRGRIGALPKSLVPAMAGVFERESALAVLPLIRIPVLVFSGQEDLPRPPAWAEQMVERLPNAELVRLPKIGHSNILEAPEIVIPRTIEFLQTH